MDIIKTQKELNILFNSNSYVDRKVLKKHNDRLLREIRKNSDSIEAYSLLSIVKLELSHNVKLAIKYLKSAINNENITNEQYTMIATNIAYILTSEPLDDNSKKEALNYLTEAVKRKSDHPETYYGLGMYFYKNNDILKALKYLKKAVELSNDEKYAKAYAVCLITDGQYNNVLYYISLINEKPLNLLLTAVTEFHKRDFIKTKQLLDCINESDYDYYSYEIANLYLFVGEYKKYTEIIDRERFLFDKELAHTYAFAMHKLGENEKADKKLQCIIEEKNEIIADADIADFSNKKDYNRFIQDTKNETSEIIDGFAMVEVKPEYKFSLQIEADCYYIGCPRHSKYD